MTIRTTQTEIAGRKYEVVTDSAKRDQPMFCYCQVYRIRKDGTRGRHLQSNRGEAWAVWQTVRDQVHAADSNINHADGEDQ